MRRRLSLLLLLITILGLSGCHWWFPRHHGHSHHSHHSHTHHHHH